MADFPSNDPAESATGLRRAASFPAEGCAVVEEEKPQRQRMRRGGSLDLGKPKKEAGMSRTLRKMGIRAHEAGTRNKTKMTRRTMWNQCFYLSIAHSYMGSQEKDRHTKRLARRLRYAIEAAVLEKHPSWSRGLKDSRHGTGPAMVFADFLQIAMQVDSVPKEINFLSRLAVCVVDSVNGHAEAYIGPEYSSLTRTEQEKHFIALLHVPGHYCCLVRDDAEGSKLGVNYDEFKHSLNRHGIFCIETLV